MIVIMVFKQLLMNIWEWLKNRFTVGKRIESVDKLFKVKYAEAEV